jgi:hypothetical protein
MRRNIDNGSLDKDKKALVEFGHLGKILWRYIYGWQADFRNVIRGT